jgi:hypothetical protein
MLELLSDSDTAPETVTQLIDSTPPSDPYPLQSTLNVIRDLLQRDLPVKDRLLATGIELQARLPGALRGESFQPAGAA